jgi:hypothetical protein
MMQFIAVEVLQGNRHVPAPPRVVFTSLFGCAFFTYTIDDKIMGEE